MDGWLDRSRNFHQTDLMEGALEMTGLLDKPTGLL
jgi:hypothetical protein